LPQDRISVGLQHKYCINQQYKHGKYIKVVSSSRLRPSVEDAELRVESLWDLSETERSWTDRLVSRNPPQLPSRVRGAARLHIIITVMMIIAIPAAAVQQRRLRGNKHSRVFARIKASAAIKCSPNPQFIHKDLCFTAGNAFQMCPPDVNNARFCPISHQQLAPFLPIRLNFVENEMRYPQNGSINDARRLRGFYTMRLQINSD